MNSDCKRAPAAVCSFILGIVSLLLAVIPIIGATIGLIALISGLFSVRKIMKSDRVLRGMGLAQTGLIMGSLAFLLGGGWTVYTATVYNNLDLTPVETQPGQTGDHISSDADSSNTEKAGSCRIKTDSTRSYSDEH